MRRQITFNNLCVTSKLQHLPLINGMTFLSRVCGGDDKIFPEITAGITIDNVLN